MGDRDIHGRIVPGSLEVDFKDKLDMLYHFAFEQVTPCFWWDRHPACRHARGRGHPDWTPDRSPG